VAGSAFDDCRAASLEERRYGPASRELAVVDFSSSSLWLTEAGSQRRASMPLVAGEDALRALDPGGLGYFRRSLKRTIVLAAKPAEDYSPTGHCRVCHAEIGRKRSKTWSF
jgi:hypothetical protein